MFFGRFGKKDKNPENHNNIEAEVQKIFTDAETASKETDQNAEQIHWQKCPMPGCSSELVYLQEKNQLNDIDWEVTLLCPNCFTARKMIVDRKAVRKFLKTARIGREQLLKQYEELQQDNMEDDAEKIISALHEGRLLPIDF